MGYIVKNLKTVREVYVTDNKSKKVIYKEVLDKIC